MSVRRWRSRQLHRPSQLSSQGRSPRYLAPGYFQSTAFLRGGWWEVGRGRHGIGFVVSSASSTSSNAPYLIAQASLIGTFVIFGLLILGIRVITKSLRKFPDGVASMEISSTRLRWALMMLLYSFPGVCLIWINLVSFCPDVTSTVADSWWAGPSEPWGGYRVMKVLGPVGTIVFVVYFIPMLWKLLRHSIRRWASIRIDDTAISYVDGAHSAVTARWDSIVDIETNEHAVAEGAGWIIVHYSDGRPGVFNQFRIQPMAFGLKHDSLLEEMYIRWQEFGNAQVRDDESTWSDDD